MDRQLTAPLLIRPLGAPKTVSSNSAYTHLVNFLPSLPAGPSRTQIERLADSLGVQIGAIAPSESDRREAERAAQRAKRRAEKKRLREEEERRTEQERQENLLETLGEKGEDGDEKLDEGDASEGEADGEMEQGGADFEDEADIGDRGDVEYGDVPEDDSDEDQPDHDDGMEVDDKE